MRIRQGNDFIFLWAIERNGLPENLSNAVNVRLHFKNFDCVGNVQSFQIVDGNIVRVEVAPKWASRLGAYRLILSYEFEDESYSDGDRKCVVDVLAFNIVPKTSEADDLTEMAKTTDIMIGLRGSSAYEVWLKDNPDKTKEDYYNWLQKPGTDIAETVGLQEQARVEAEELRVLAEQDRQTNTQEAISNAENATENANTAAQNADDARLAIQSDLGAKAFHGYESIEVAKTLKEVEDNASVKIENLVVNGDFRNGLNGWSGTASRSIIDDEVEISDGYLQRLDAQKQNNDYYYIQVKVRTEGVASIREQDGVATTIPPNSDFIYSEENNKDYNALRLHIVGTVYIDYVTMFNLTATFGAGNEPTKEEMDLLISTLGIDYFEGEITIPAQKVMQWLLESHQQSKAKIYEKADHGYNEEEEPKTLKEVEEMPAVVDSDIYHLATKSDGLAIQASSGIVDSSDGAISHIIELKEGTKYTISRKVFTDRFRIATFSEMPVIYSNSIRYFILDDTGLEAKTITASENEKYALIVTSSSNEDYPFEINTLRPVQEVFALKEMSAVVDSDIYHLATKSNGLAIATHNGGVVLSNSAISRIIGLKEGAKYTISRKVFTDRFRIATFSEMPVSNSDAIRFFILDDTGLEAKTFRASENEKYALIVTSNSNEGYPFEINTLRPVEEVFVNREEVNQRFKFEPLSHISLDVPSDIITMDKDAKEALFESVINGLPNHTVIKSTIGRDQSDTFDMFGYEITPNNGYSVTVGFTSHIHTSEKYNPAALIGMLNELGNPKCKHTVINWMRDNVRFVGVFMCNPWGYSRNSRNQSRAVNINRNFDYAWDENTEDGAAKGEYPMSEAENQNIASFFAPFVKDMDFHVDWHDAPTYSIPYRPAYNKHSLEHKPITEAVEYLIKTNLTNPYGYNRYNISSGGTTNYFTDTLGIPSITSEVGVAYWTNNKFDIKSNVTKNTEMGVIFHTALLNNVVVEGHSSYYDKIRCCAYRSSERALNTWSVSQIETKASETSFTKDEVNNVFSNSPLTPVKSVLFIGGFEDDNNISNLTLLRSMQEIDEVIGNNWNTNVQWLNQNVKLNFAFGVNTSKIQSLMSNISPDIIIYVKGNTIDENKTQIKVSKEEYLSHNMINDFDVSVISSKDTMELELGDDFISITPNGEVEDPDRYSYIVVNWIKALINSAINATL